MENIINYIKEKHVDFMPYLKIEDNKIMINQDRYFVFQNDKYSICRKKYTSYETWTLEPIKFVDSTSFETIINELCQHNYILYSLKNKTNN